MLTRPIPPSAMLVVNEIRKDRPAPPKDKPTRVNDEDSFRWWSEEASCYFCPMGLIASALVMIPTSNDEFLPSSVLHDSKNKNAIKLFGEWWDEQTDVEAAIKAVWYE